MTLNEHSYLKSYLPVYRGLDIEPALLVQFPIILPFHLPFRTGTCVTFSLSDAEACTLCFSTLTTQQGVHAGVISPDPVQTTLHRSRVEMTLVCGDQSIIDLERDLSPIFDTLLDALNHLVVAYMVVTKDYRVHRVSREMLEFGTVWRAIDPSPWNERSTGLFLLHWQVPFEKPELAEDRQNEVVWFANVIEKDWNPFILPAELLLSARRDFLGGAYREAVVFAQTAVETFLSLLLAAAMREEGAAEPEIERVLQETAFATRLRKEYHPRFGGSWDTSAASGSVASWYESTYRLRNRVTHSGHLPSFEQAGAAIDAADEMVRYCVERIRKVKQRYPELQKYFASTHPPADT